MITLRINNYEDINLREKGTLSAAVDKSATAVALPMTSNLGNAIGTPLLIGYPGTEQCEIQFVTGRTGVNTLTVPQLLFPHDVNEPVVGLVGDQIKLYRAPRTPGNAQPSDTLYSPANVPVSIDTDQTMTDVNDPTGGDDFWYKYVFYNSQTSEETALAAAIASSAGVQGGYCPLSEIRRTAGFQNNQWITDSDVGQARTEAQREIDNTLIGLYTVPFTDPIDPMIFGITKLLAGGRLQTENPGPGGVASAIYKQGQDKMADARNMLAMIKTRQYTLTDVNGVSIQSPSTPSSQFLPRRDPWFTTETRY